MTNPPRAPVDAESQQSLANARLGARQGDLAGAANAYERYLKAAPGDAAIAHEAADIWRRLGDTAALERVFERAVAANPSEPFLRSSHIEAVLNHQRPEEALILAEAAIAADPSHSGFHALKGLSLQTLGRTAEAKDAFWAALGADPDNMHALFNLTPLESGDGRAKVLAALDAAWDRRSDLPTMDQIALGFARGRAAEHAGRFDDAYESYAEGAATKRKSLTYNEAAIAGLQDRHMQLFTKARLEAAALPKDHGNDLVFIVSLPRSGSTLIEQILASHSQMSAIGERDFITTAFDKWYAQAGGNIDALFSESALRAAGDHYRALATEAAGDQNHGTMIVDKTPSNHAYLGFIACIFPGAKIIHAVRNPVDTAFSCFTTLFYFGLEWSYDLGELGRAVRRYQKFLGYWMRALKSPPRPCRYEDLLADPESEVRQLLEFCGMAWEPACLEFHKTERAVATASVIQVRQPLYKTAQGRAAKFGDHLAPLTRTLGRAADPDWYLK